MNIYLDIDGVLLKDGKPILDIENFIIPLVENNDCYWLTTHCKGDTKHTLEYLSDKLPAELMSYVKKIKPTNWQTLKTEAIDFTKDFRWYDDYIMEAEKDVLAKNNCANKFIKK